MREGPQHTSGLGSGLGLGLGVRIMLVLTMEKNAVALCHTLNTDLEQVKIPILITDLFVK